MATRDRLPLVHACADLLAWGVALLSAWLVRVDFEAGRIDTTALLVVWLIAGAAQATVGASLGLYRRRWRYGSFDEFRALATTVAVTGVLLVMARTPAGVPWSVPFTSTAYAVLFTVAGRSAWRQYRSRRTTPTDAEPVVVIGAGEGAEQIVRALLASPNSPYRPVALVDDDVRKAKLRIHGVRVQGTLAELDRVAQRLGVATALFAIPSADVDVRRRLAGLTTLQLVSLPSVRDMFNAPSVADIAPITPEQLLGRSPADIDNSAIAAYVTGQRVLVTGAGGSIGSELCRQLARLEPAQLIMLDRDESGLHATQLSIAGHGLLTDPNLVLADLRDPGRIDEVLRCHQPHVVFHAAALKHLTMLQNHPDEAWKTNVEGTQYLLEAARRHGVGRFVNISTDKAADPVSVLGFTKRITERLTAAAALPDQTGQPARYLSVRFGNVLGSRGSVLSAFDAQVRRGGPITLTHPDTTRFFMTVAEAVALTLYAGAIGEAGQAMVLDMGQPVRIADVAHRYAHQADPPLSVVHTGLRPGEKLHEVLLSADEADHRPVHPLISHVDVPPLCFPTCQTLWSATQSAQVDHGALLAQLCRIDQPTAPLAVAG